MAPLPVLHGEGPGGGVGLFERPTQRILRTKLRRRGDDRVDREAEMLVDVGPRGARAETRHANEDAGRSDVTVPAEARGGLDADTRCGAQHLRAVLLALLLEQLPAGHRDDGDVLALLAQGF